MIFFFFLQNICQDVNNKRDEMKWLVQTLDMLLPYYPKKSFEEQTKLDELVLRYKNLLPTIEVTVTRTEILSKCYTYRMQVKEVSN